ncbi:MAG: metallophosphoesterase [Comamonas sp.]|nr:metallophosphoesterase [Comamonas sp.]
MSLIQPLPQGPLDIVGDIHGELPALNALLQHLGYDARGRHPQGRTLVFVGDFVDRGPDSPGVVSLVQGLVQTGRALAILGNHEINLLRHDPKDGSGWFFAARLQSDLRKYPGFARCHDKSERSEILRFLSTLPLGLERSDLRVIHAAWHQPSIAQARGQLLGNARLAYDAWERQASQAAEEKQITARMQAENEQWPHSLEDDSRRPPFLQAHCDNELNKSCFNPLKVLTTGLERQAHTPFFAGNKWRFVQRHPWWDDYEDDIPVVMGHYWRSTQAQHRTEEGLFASLSPFAWHGRKNNVFCVDFSVGARAQARKNGKDTEHLRLAALRWPERELVFDDGQHQATQLFERPQTQTQAVQPLAAANSSSATAAHRGATHCPAQAPNKRAPSHSSSPRG